MKKSGLKDIKRRNWQVILESVMEAGSLSRVEIAQNTSLAASTVSTLVSELLSEGLLTEAGTVGTPGRKSITASYFDMTLAPLKTAVLSRCYVSGNDLLALPLMAVVICIMAVIFGAWLGGNPTNTQNVWTANFCEADVNGITKKLLPYLWALTKLPAGFILFVKMCRFLVAIL